MIVHVLEWGLFLTTCWYGTGYLVTVLLDLGSIDKFGRLFFLLPFLWPLTVGKWIREYVAGLEAKGERAPWADTPEGVAMIEEMHAMLKRVNEREWRQENGMA